MNHLELLRRKELAANLRALADRLEALSVETPRSEVSDLAIEIEVTARWLDGARDRVLEHRRVLAEGGGS